MTDPEDRVLDHALSQVLGEPEEVDLTPRILAAWKRGVQGSGVTAEAEPNGREPSWVGAPPRRVSRPALRLVAASVVAAAAAGIALWVLRPGQAADPPLAVASRPVELMSALDGLARVGVEVREGDAVVVGPGLGSELALAGGGVVSLGERTVLSMEPGRAELRLGSLRVADAAGLVLASGPVRIEPAAGAALSLSREIKALSKPVGEPEPFDRVAADLLRGKAGAPGALAIAVQSGEVALLFGRYEDRVAAGDERLLRLEPGRGAVAAGPEGMRVGKLCSSVFGSMGPLKADPGGMWGPGMGGQPARELMELLSKRPHLWSAVEYALEELFSHEVETDPRRARALDLLAMHPSELALELGRELWMRFPESYEVHHVLAFAERGAFEFEREVAGLVAFHDESAPYDPTLPAAYLAFRGRDDGLVHLMDAVQEISLASPELAETLIAAAALRELGVERPWERVHALLEREVGEALEREDLDEAARLVLEVELFHRLPESGRPPRLASLPMDVVRHHETRRRAIDGAEAVRALLEELLAD